MTLDTGRMDVALEAALNLAAEKPWNTISLAEIARACNKSLSDFYGEIDKHTLVEELDSRLDKACSAEPVDPDGTLRERLFDVAMLRFEEMEPKRAAILSIRKSWMQDPLRRLAAAKRRVKTAKWILTCAEEDGPLLGPRAVILSGILFRAEDAWAKETSADFTQTVSQLDRDLRSVSEFADRISSFSGNFQKADKKEAADNSAAF